MTTDENIVYNAQERDTATHKTGCISIRYAEIEDLQDVLSMYIAALSELKDEVLPYDIEKCADEVCFSWSQAPCVLIEKDGEKIGFAGLKTIIPAYTTSACISEYMFYIAPEFRSIKLAKMLSDECKKIADRFGLPLYFTHFLNGHSVGHKEKFLERWGYKPYAVACSYGGKHG